MAKIMNTVFGISVAVILFIVVLLGIRVFYHAPEYDNYCNQSVFSKPLYNYDFSVCSDNISVGACRILIKDSQAQLDEQNQEMERCQTAFNDAEKIYGKNVFIITSVIGIIAIIASLFLFGFINIAAGTAFSGLALIVYGFMRGWQGTGDVLKFVVGLIIAILVVVFAVIVNKRYIKNPC